LGYVLCTEALARGETILLGHGLCAHLREFACAEILVRHRGFLLRGIQGKKEN
jgi:hypothetical protein